MESPVDSVSGDLWYGIQHGTGRARLVDLWYGIQHGTGRTRLVLNNGQILKPLLRLGWEPQHMLSVHLWWWRKKRRATRREVLYLVICF